MQLCISVGWSQPGTSPACFVQLCEAWREAEEGILCLPGHTACVQCACRHLSTDKSARPSSYTAGELFA